MNTPISIQEIMLRILAATVAGALIGLERESRGRAAGLRTTILACVAAAVAMILSEFLFVQSAAASVNGNWRPDPARLGAGILTGIGFLGAGTILRHANVIRGVTTAATLWFVTVLGLAFGAGRYDIGALGTLVALATLFALPSLEKHIPTDGYATLVVTMDLDGLSEQAVAERLRGLGMKIHRMELSYDLAARHKTVSFDVRFNRRDALELPVKTAADLRGNPGVVHIKWS